MIGNFRLPMQGAATASTSSPMVWSQAYYDNIYANSYTRPSDWLTLPTVLSTDQKVVMLHAVYDHDANFCALQCASNYTVNWGDGVIENFAANVSAYHLFSYANHSGTDSTRGHRQAIVTVQPQAGFNLTKLDLNIKHNQATLNTYNTSWLDIRMAGSLISTLIIGSAGPNVNQRNLEQFDFIGTNALTTGADLFYNCFSLCKVVNLYTNGFTNMSQMFYFCISLQTIPLLNTAAVITMASMFQNCYSLITIPLLITANVIDMSNMFSNCRSLQNISLVNTIKVNTMAFMLASCFSLQTIPLLNTAAVTTMSSMFNSCSSLQTIPLLNTVVVTTMASMFQSCNSLQTIPLLNTAAVTAMDSMFASCNSLQTLPLLNTSLVNNMLGMFSGCSALQTIPALNANNVTVAGRLGTIFNVGPTISKISLTNIKITLSIANLKLSAPAIIEVFSNLATVSGQTLTISGNWGTASLTAANRLIATNKGWTLVG